MSRWPGCALLWLSAACASAADLENLVRRADSAVFGVVQGSRTERDRHGFLFTVYQVRVEESYFGAESGSVEIWQAGGIDPATRTGLLVPGTPHFRDGERAVLFVSRSRSGRQHAIGGVRAGDAGELGARIRRLARGRGSGARR